MLIKDLIEQLQKILEKEKEYSLEMGEPSIAVDLFETRGRAAQYIGYSKDVIVKQLSDSGTYLISAFAEEHDIPLKQ